MGPHLLQSLATQGRRVVYETEDEGRATERGATKATRIHTNRWELQLCTADATRIGGEALVQLEQPQPCMCCVSQLAIK